jgi:hypothetical protein
MRPWILALAFVGVLVGGISGCASARYAQPCEAAPVAATGARPFDGSAYAFGSSGSYATYYPAPDGSDYSRSQPYVPNYYGAFPRAAARDRAVQFYEPGPYYYTPAESFTPGYYSYYYTPGYFRY